MSLRRQVFFVWTSACLRKRGGSRQKVIIVLYAFETDLNFELQTNLKKYNVLCFCLNGIDTLNLKLKKEKRIL